MRTGTFYSNDRRKQNLHNKGSKFNRTNYELVMQLYYVSKTEIINQPRLPRNDFRRPVPAKKPGLFDLMAEHISSYRNIFKRPLMKVTPQYS